MTREEAIAEVNKLGLTGQAREQKINELIGKKASDFKGGTAKENKSLKNKLVASPEDMQKMTSDRDDVKGAIRRSQIANPSVGVVDRVTGNVTGLNEDILDPTALKSSDLKADGTVKEKSFTLGNGASGNFVGAETKNSGSSGNGSSGTSSSSGLDSRTEDFMNRQKNISNEAKQNELKDIDIDAIKNWKDMDKTSKRTVEAYGNIDKKYINELPTFMYRRYKNGEFGNLDDPESKKNAQLRLAHFMINGLGSKLKVASNLAMINAGKTPMFSDTTSDYEKFQNSNLEQGLANRWKVNNAETEEVIKLANKEADNEQDARFYVEQLTRDNNLKNAWNMMDQNQKLYSINVSREIGKLIGDMNMKELANFITARAADGSLSEEQAVVAGLAVAVSHTPELLEKIPDNNIYKKALMKLFGN